MLLWYSKCRYICTVVQPLCGPVDGGLPRDRFIPTPLEYHRVIREFLSTPPFTGRRCRRFFSWVGLSEPLEWDLAVITSFATITVSLL